MLSLEGLDGMHAQAKELLLSQAMALQPDAQAVKCTLDYAAS